MRQIPRLLAFLSLLALAACAEGARTGQMILTPAATPEAAVRPELKEAFWVGAVSGGGETNPMWMSNVSAAEFAEALRLSLIAHQMLSPVQERARYHLDASLKQVDRPFVGFDLTVTTTVDYAVRDSAKGEPRYSKTVVAPYTATVSDAFLAVKRLQLANEGSVKENIRRFIEAVTTETWTGQPGAAAPAAAVATPVVQTAAVAAAPPPTPRSIDFAAYAKRPLGAAYVVTSRSCGWNYKLTTSQRVQFGSDGARPWQARFQGSGMTGETYIVPKPDGLEVSVATRTAPGSVILRDHVEELAFAFTVPAAEIAADGSFTGQASNTGRASRCGDYRIDFAVQ
jgi:hypothetical protein